MKLVRQHASHGKQAYSLVELLLTVALLLLFAGLSVVSLGSMSQGSALNEGTLRFETLLRFARAQSACLGRRVRVEFLPDTNQVALLTQSSPLNSLQLSWEPNPAAEPGVFQPLAASRWGLEQVNESVGVEAVQLAEPVPAEMPSEDPEEPGPLALSGEQLPPAAPPCIIFNPDGSCDSAVVTLASRDNEDARRVLVQLEGFTGKVSHQEPALPEELENEVECNGMSTPARETAGTVAEQ